jgi:4'-phosphopantetheinyl transferase EntD
VSLAAADSSRAAFSIGRERLFRQNPPMNNPPRTPDNETDALLANLFPACVAVCFSSELPADAKLEPAEQTDTERMAAKRLMEFTHGRYCAHEAMRRLGIPVSAISKGEDRAPVWPSRLVGSISHRDQVAVAAIAHSHDIDTLGLDIEGQEALKPEIIHMICRPDEQAALNDGHLAKLLFSIKEAVYKCIYPRVGCYVDFKEIEILLDVTGESYRVRSHSTKFDAGLTDRLEGRFHIKDQLIFSTAWIMLQ